MENPTPNSTPDKTNNPNKIGDLDFSLGGAELPTNPKKVYRYVGEQGALEDIAKTGVVRNAHSAGVKKTKNRWGDSVYWHKGVEGRKKGVNSGFVIEAPYSVASQRQVRAEDVTGVYQNRMGKLTNLLEEEEEEEEENRPRRSRGFSGEQSENTKVVYRIGIIGMFFLVGLATFFDIVELVLSLFTAAAGGYIKYFASYIVFPFLFWIFKIPFWKGNKRVQKMSTMIIGAIVALIPIVSDILPELAISVFVTILYSRVEDRMGIQGQLLQRNTKIVSFKRMRSKVRRR